MWCLLIFLAVPGLTVASEYTDLYDGISSYELYMTALAYWDLNNVTQHSVGGLDVTGFCQDDGIDVLHGAAVLTSPPSWPKISLGSSPYDCPVKPTSCEDGFTVGLWISLRADVDSALPDNDCMLISLNDTSAGGFQIFFSSASESIEFAVGSRVFASTEAYNATGEWLWNHLGFTLDPYRMVNVSVNGQETDLVEGQVNPWPRDVLIPCNYMVLDELAIWDRVLTGKEMLSLRLDPFNMTVDELWTTEMPTTAPPTTTAQPTTEHRTTTGMTTTVATTGAGTTESETTTGGDAPTPTGQASTPTSATTVNPTTPTTSQAQSTPSTSAPGTSAPSTSAHSTNAPSTNAAVTTSETTPAELILPDVAAKITESVDYEETVDYLKFLHDFLISEGEGIDAANGPVTEDIFMAATERLTTIMEGVGTQDRHSFLELFMSIVEEVMEINTNISEKSLWGDGETFIAGSNLINDVEDMIEIYLTTGEDSEVQQQITNTYTDIQMSVFAEGQDQMTLTFNQDGTGDDVQILIPSSIFGNDTSGRVAGTIFFTGIQDDLPQGVSTKKVSSLSPVISILVSAASTDGFQEPVSIVAPVPVADDEEATCAYLAVVDEEIVWATEGCTTTSMDSSSTKCECNHLTNFAVLVSPRPIEVSKGNELALNILTYLGLIISIICLIITLFILNWLRQLNSTRISILKHTSAALLIAQTLFLIGSIYAVGQSLIACKIIGALTHYAFLAVFCWMLLQGVYMYMKVRSATKSNIRLLYFCLFGWGIPLLIVAISFGAEYSNYGIDGICWISVQNGAGPLVAFIGPAYLILLVNLAVVGMVLHVFMSVKANKDKSEKDKIKSGLRAVIVMVPILGLTWLFGLLMISGSIVFVYLFIIFNVLQGGALFLLHIVMNEEVKQALLKKRNKIAAGQDSTTLFSKVIRSGADPSTCDSNMASGKF